MRNDQQAKRDGWCILRTSGPRTLPLAKSLAEAGFDVWTPIAPTSRRRPRSNDRIEVEVAILPTFVFARARHLVDLFAILALPQSPHPSFSVFHYCSKIPLLAERDIRDLREAEERARLAKRRSERHHFPIGERVRLDEGSFAGMSGIVESGDGKFALVAFGGGFRVKIATFLLRPDEVEQTQATSGITGLAA